MPAQPATSNQQTSNQLLMGTTGPREPKFEDENPGRVFIIPPPRCYISSVKTTRMRGTAGSPCPTPPYQLLGGNSVGSVVGRFLCGVVTGNRRYLSPVFQATAKKHPVQEIVRGVGTAALLFHSRFQQTSTLGLIPATAAVSKPHGREVAHLP